jgi:murein DD-endopeptidase MepM/ murein hydrolase activator NlpD
MSSLVEPSGAKVVARLFVLAVIGAGLSACSTDIGRFNDNPFAGTFSRGNIPPTELTGSVQTGPSSAPVGRVEAQPLPGSATALPAPPPTRRSSTGPAPARAAAASVKPGSATHVVAPNETLSSIAKLYGKSRADIAKANAIKPDAIVRTGQRLAIPGVTQAQVKTAAPAAKGIADGAPKGTGKPDTAAKPAPALQTAAKPPASATPAGAKPGTAKTAGAEPVATARLAAPASDAIAEAGKEAQASATGAVPTFRWPVRGRVIAGFGPKPNGQQNDGINLAVPEGTSVKAAEDGVVAYSGNELKGYGNLVLVRHSNGYVTAYAHASELKVKRGEAVKRGQIIALAGQTGTVNSPQLHFEIRKGSSPVDPTQFLSGN